MTKIYHNPRCSKSRQTLHLLEEKGEEIETIEYLVNPPSKNEIEEIIRMLRISPFELIRKGEADYKENFKGKDLSNDQWIQAMVDYPKLIERPIVIKDGKAELGRPPENVLEIL
ncbi:MAG: arsenate reductase (glutaredoxin) [Cytophagales bacterium]|nr:arsenate reductase (glutaredoxin) [Cytophagales bacterium]